MNPIEIIDLADGAPSIPYSGLAPRAYRQSNSPHRSVQEDKFVRLPKCPKFSYSSGEKPDFRFLCQTAKDDPFDEGIDDDDFPSPSELCPTSEEASRKQLKTMIDLQYHEPVLTEPSRNGAPNDYNPETDQIDDSCDFTEGTAPVTTTSFANDIFDFNAFDDYQSSGLETSSYLPNASSGRGLSPNAIFHETRKRKRSPSPELGRGHFTTDCQDANKESAQHASTPGWVDNFDAEIVDGLKGIVEFID